MATLDNKNILGIIIKGHVTKTQEKEITTNGVYTPDEGYDAFNKVTVNIPPSYIRVTSEDDLPEIAAEGTIAIVEV